MGINYKLMEWRFNWSAWGAGLRDLMTDTEVETWAELLEVHETTIARWRQGVNHNKRFPYPNMTNFLKVCNALEINPSDMFELVEV